MVEILDKIDGFVWGVPMLVLLVGTGIFISLFLRFVQFRHFSYAWKLISGKFDNPEDAGEVTHFQALSTALSATIGTGNIAGVGTAIALGGPGAIFWMWITAIFGMGLKYAECLLSLNFRQINEDGTAGGGPMYYLEHGLKQKWLGITFAVFAAIAAFGIGNMVQANSVAEPLLDTFGIPKLVTGIVIAVLCFAVIVGGVKRIGAFAAKIVPFMAAFYVLGALILIFTNLSGVPAAFAAIFEGAFSGTAATGGFIGAGVAQAIRFGVARGVFSNEAGLGSAPIAHGAAKTEEPVREGLVAMLGPFIDTLVICTMTGLAIIITGAFALKGADGSALTGSILTKTAFENGIPFAGGGYIVTIGIVFFAFSTVIGWSYYGDRCIDYLFGQKAVLPYRIIYCLIVPVGATIKLSLVWLISDIFNALMAIPNLIGLIFLSPIVLKLTKEYFSSPERVYPKHVTQGK
ncbi:MAG: sodium:alanine symporter family protein [Deltaproteobacteria bacterium]|nr:sodium:alanine symporter family protein [Deltaproteobacteria bacterium]